MYKKSEGKKIIGVVKNSKGERVYNVYEDREGHRWAVFNPRCTWVDFPGCFEELSKYNLMDYSEDNERVPDSEIIERVNERFSKAM